MKLIGTGFGRTGTSSLKRALEILGYGPCYHMTEAIFHPSHVSVWHRAGKGEAVDFENLLRGYNSGVDYPVTNFYKELMALYPEAKVLLSVRDSERWYQSSLDTINRLQ